MSTDEDPERGTDRRKDLRDMLDELERYFEEMERDIQTAVHDSLSAARSMQKPFVAGFSFKLGPEGRPSMQFFGDSPRLAGGYRSPLTEQIVDQKGGTLRLVLDMPGVEKGDIELGVAERTATISAARGLRKYKAEVGLKTEVDPASAKAEYRNGVLEILFSIRDKDNKGYTRIDVA